MHVVSVLCFLKSVVTCVVQPAWTPGVHPHMPFRGRGLEHLMQLEQHLNARMNRVNSVFLRPQGEHQVFTQPRSSAILFFAMKSHKAGNDTMTLEFSLKAFKLILAPGGNSHPRRNQVMSTHNLDLIANRITIP